MTERDDQRSATGDPKRSRRDFLRQSGLLTGATLLTMAAETPLSHAADPAPAPAVPSPSPASVARPSPGGADPTPAQMVLHLRRANEIAKRAKQFGHHPFGCILVAPDNETVLLEQGNVDTVNHAEATLVRTAWTNFAPEYLWGCTLYTTFEPCVMCTGTMYWANVGRVVYGAAEKRLLELTGSSSQNPTLDVPCRYVFEHSQKNVRVWGPIPELEAELVEPHRSFWK
jgi:tRNA(Arg) A34 adenosine deaminase TadA